MSLIDIKKELKKFDKEKLIELISELYRKNKSVKEYFDFFVNPDEQELYRKYEQKITAAFNPKFDQDPNLKEGRQAVSDFKKLEPSTELAAALMLHYVECGVRFTNEFGDINEPFYASLEKMYLQALTLMKKENILEQFKVRVCKIVKDSEDTGWGFHDYLDGVYYDFFGEDYEDLKP